MPTLGPDRENCDQPRDHRARYESEQIPQPLDNEIHVEFSLADNDYDAAILRSTVGCVVACDRICRTEALRGDMVSWNTVRCQEVGDRLRPVIAQRNIDRVVGGAVGITG